MEGSSLGLDPSDEDISTQLTHNSCDNQQTLEQGTGPQAQVWGLSGSKTCDVGLSKWDLFVQTKLGGVAHSISQGLQASHVIQEVPETSTRISFERPAKNGVVASTTLIKVGASRS